MNIGADMIKLINAYFAVFAIVLLLFVFIRGYDGISGPKYKVNACISDSDKEFVNSDSGLIVYKVGKRNYLLKSFSKVGEEYYTSTLMERSFSIIDSNYHSIECPTDLHIK